jgi:hypothetical protein
MAAVGRSRGDSQEEARRLNIQLMQGRMRRWLLLVQIVNIGQNSSKFALIPKKPNGVYLYWALTHQNKVFAPKQSV